MSETKLKKVTLNEPIKSGDVEIKEITVREPKAGELRGLNMGGLLNGDTNELLKILPRIVNPLLLESELETLSACDFVELGEAVTHFLYSPSRKEKLLAQ